MGAGGGPGAREARACPEVTAENAARETMATCIRLNVQCTAVCLRGAHASWATGSRISQGALTVALGSLGIRLPNMPMCLMASTYCARAQLVKSVGVDSRSTAMALLQTRAFVPCIQKNAASLSRSIRPVRVLRVQRARMSVSAKQVISTEEAPAALGPYSQVQALSP